MKFISIHDGHTSSVGYMVDGKVVFAIQEERLTKEKNTGGFPFLALQETLDRNQLTHDDIDGYLFVGHQSANSMKKREQVLDKYKAFFEPDSFKQSVKKKLPSAVVDQYSKKYLDQHKEERLKPILALGIPESKIRFIDHHECHAASTAYGSGFDENTVVITADSSGDGICASVSMFTDGKLDRLVSIPMHHSPARLYSLLTYAMGMVPMEHEYKIMGLAPYAEHSPMAQEIKEELLSWYKIDHNAMTFMRKDDCKDTKIVAKQIENLIKYKQFHAVSAGFQLFIEELVTEWVEGILKKTGASHLCLAGGLFMNVKLNGLISELDQVENMFVFPSCGDESNVFGALYTHYFKTEGKKPAPLGPYYMGGSFTNDDVKTAYDSYKFQNCKVKITKIDNINQHAAKLLANNEIVARFNGRMEFGARSLGNRSIMANPVNPDSVRTINKMIKSRDFWMPFAPSMIDADRYLDNPKGIKAPYMIMTFPIKDDCQDKLRGAIHPYDLTCRPQVVTSDWNPGYHELISTFGEETGETVILNTSFNLHGLPVCYTPEDAFYVLDNSGLNYLAIEDYLVEKI